MNKILALLRSLGPGVQFTPVSLFGMDTEYRETLAVLAQTELELLADQLPCCGGYIGRDTDIPMLPWVRCYRCGHPEGEHEHELALVFLRDPHEVRIVRSMRMEQILARKRLGSAVQRQRFAMRETLPR